MNPLVGSALFSALCIGSVLIFVTYSPSLGLRVFTIGFLCFAAAVGVAFVVALVQDLLARSNKERM